VLLLLEADAVGFAQTFDLYRNFVAHSGRWELGDGRWQFNREDGRWKIITTGDGSSMQELEEGR
jgi:hypothetical protein